MGIKPDHEDFKDINRGCQLVLLVVSILITGIVAGALMVIKAVIGL